MYTRALAAAGAAALLMGLVATAPTPAQAGLRMNSQELNGLRLNGLTFDGLKINGLRFNGTDGLGIVHTGPGDAGFNLNAVTLHAVTLPDTAR